MKTRGEEKMEGGRRVWSMERKGQSPPSCPSGEIEWGNGEFKDLWKEGGEKSKQEIGFNSF